MTIQKMMASTLSMALLLPAAGAVADDHGKADDHGNESSQAMLQLPIAGIVAAGGGIFTGTLSVQEFVARDGQVMAIGMLSGSVTNAAGAPVGTALVGPMALPVQVGPGVLAPTVAVASAAAAAAPAQSCEVLHVELGAVNFNALGLQVTTLPVSIDLSGQSGGTNVLGQLICTILNTVGNVLGLVNLLNQLLGVVGGLTGGLHP